MLISNKVNSCFLIHYMFKLRNLFYFHFETLRYILKDFYQRDFFSIVSAED